MDDLKCVDLKEERLSLKKEFKNELRRVLIESSKNKMETLVTFLQRVSL